MTVCWRGMRAGVGATVQLGYTKGLIFRGNFIDTGEDGSVGLYIWGNSRYNDQPGEDVMVLGNHITANETAISLNGAKNVRIQGNLTDAEIPLKTRRTEQLTSDIEP